MKHVATAGACLAFVLGTPADAGTPVDGVPASRQWSSTVDLQCGASDIALVTQCEDKLEDLPFCPRQTIRFQQGGRASTVVYRYAFNDGNQPFIAGVACYRHEKASYLVLTRTNFANCHICEWTDVYALSGAYLGSTEGMDSKRTLRRKPLAAQVQADLNSIVRKQWPPLAQSGFISRAKP